jgi:protein ImuA
MVESHILERLRHMAAIGVRAQTGNAADSWLATGLPRGKLHEVYSSADEAACGAGFAIMQALLAGATPLLWLRLESVERAAGRLHATGLAELGLPPDALIVALVPDAPALLRAGADAARCPGLGTVLIESSGPMRGLDLTATRRLMLAAETSGVTVVSLRIDASPEPSAAETRWSVAAAASSPLAADAPGLPAIDIELLRRRGGPAGARWRVEWDRDTTSFRGAALSGAGLPLAADRAAARHPPAPVRRRSG